MMMIIIIMMRSAAGGGAGRESGIGGTAGELTGGVSDKAQEV
jgi:hypothetical protein